MQKVQKISSHSKALMNKLRSRSAAAGVVDDTALLCMTVCIQVWETLALASFSLNIGWTWGSWGLQTNKQVMDGSILHLHLSLNRGGCLDITDDFTTSFLHFFFTVLLCPLGLGESQACPFLDVVFPSLFLSALSSSASHCALQNGFGQTWWTVDMSIPLQARSHLINLRAMGKGGCRNYGPQMLRIKLVCKLVGALSQVNHRRLHQGWTQTSLYLQVSHFTSHHTTFHLFWAYLYSAGTQHGNLHPAGWPILFYGPTKKPVLATPYIGKNRERFGKNAGEWTGRVGISKEEIPGSKRSIYGYLLTYSRL